MATAGVPGGGKEVRIGCGFDGDGGEVADADGALEAVASTPGRGRQSCVLVHRVHASS